MAILIAGCSKPAPDPEPEPQAVKVTGVTLSQKSLSLTVGQESSLTATVAPSDAEDKTVTWTSSDPKVASVTDGKVKALSAGETTVTVKTNDGGFTAACSVSVKEEHKTISVAGVSLDKTGLEMVVDDVVTLSATVSPSDATNPKISWSTSDENVATVDGGKVTAVSPGSTTITVTTEDGGFKATCGVTVKDKRHPVTSVSLDKTEITLTIGGSAILTATVEPEDATDPSVTWSSDNEDVALVEDGSVTAVGAGSATVTVKTVDGGLTASCKVTVNPSTKVITYTTSDSQPVFLNLPESIGTLVSNTYVGNTGILVFEEEVTSIGERAFQSSSNLTGIDIPGSVTSIGDGAFMGCSALVSVDLPSVVTSVGEAAFAGCVSLEKFTGPFSSDDGRCLVNEGKLIAFAPAGLTKFTVPSGVTSIGKSVFSGCSALKELSLPAGLKEIAPGAFMECSGLVSMTVPDGVERIPGSAFKGCTSLTGVVIPSSVTVIDQYAFQDCRSLQDVVLPEGVGVVGDDCFRSCTSLFSLDLPASITRVGNNVFSGCGSLASVTVRALTPPQLGGNAFKGVPVYCNIYVPAESLEAYKASTWNDYNGRVYPLE